MMNQDAAAETPDHRPAGSTVQGKYVIIFLFGLGLLSAGLSLGYHWTLQRRPINYWGSNHARLFLHAPEITAQQVGKPETIDVSQAPGFSHIRQSLINDVSFAWDQPPPAQEPTWQYSLTFRDPAGESAEVLFDVNNGYAALASRRDQPISTAPVTSEFASFFTAQFK